MSRNAWVFALLSLAVLFALVALATPAAARLTGPCTGSINEQSMDSRRITVPVNGTVAWEFNSTGGPISKWAVRLLYAGAVVGGNAGAEQFRSETTKNGYVNVSQYARHSVGIYQLEGGVVTEEGTCKLNADIIVEGNPLTTTVGAASATITVVGMVGGSVYAWLYADKAYAAFMNLPF